MRAGMNNPPEDQIWPNRAHGFSYRLLPGSDPPWYMRIGAFGGFSFSVSHDFPKGEVSVYDKNTTFPEGQKLIHGEAPTRTLFGTSLAEIKARRVAQKFYTDEFSKFGGLVDIEAEFGDAADAILALIYPPESTEEAGEGRMDLSTAIESWGLGEPVMYRESVTEKKAAKIRGEGREPKVDYRFAFPTNPILSTRTRTMVPFHHDVKPALLGGGANTLVNNYLVALIRSEVIVERELPYALRSHPAADENSALKAIRDAAEAEQLKELTAVISKEEEGVLSLF